MNVLTLSPGEDHLPESPARKFTDPSRGPVVGSLGPKRAASPCWFLHGLGWLVNPLTSAGDRGQGPWLGVGEGGRWGGWARARVSLTLLFVICLIIKAIHTHYKIWELQKGRKEKMKVIRHPGAQRQHLQFCCSSLQSCFSAWVTHMYISVCFNCGRTL